MPDVRPRTPRLTTVEPTLDLVRSQGPGPAGSCCAAPTTRVQQQRPLRDSVVFISWKGKQCGDNPLGIAEELRRRGDDREHIWAVTDWSVPVPQAARGPAPDRGVLRGAGPVALPDLQRRHAVVARQAGRPGLRADLARHAAEADRLRHQPAPVRQRDPVPGAPGAGRWRSGTCCCRPTRSARRSCAGRSATTARSASPATPATTCCAAATRRRRRAGAGAAGRRPGKRVVLYAPTWRDNQSTPRPVPVRLRLDLERAWRDLGEDHVVLLRGHHHIADDVPPASGRLDVTSYPEIAELFLAADALITDYSSVMFDYAVTGRPMLFFAYDLDDYRDACAGSTSTSTRSARPVLGGRPTSSRRWATWTRRPTVPTPTGASRPGSARWTTARRPPRLRDIIFGELCQAADSELGGRT